MLRVAIRDGPKWVITKFVKEHNHKLMSPVKFHGEDQERILSVRRDHKLSASCQDIVQANNLLKPKPKLGHNTHSPDRFTAVSSLHDISPCNAPVTYLLQDEKDQRIQELTLELSNERQKCKRLCAAYQEQLRLVLKDI
ncbi:hypothetical protein CK203_000041 [Vitis vinifera]|uniref:FAR1 domain-containing protein n=1 Tax=Vitis vinifera TaxID=29760 RepID=A0A438KPP5_VITVI|nr:hypothetical protein CK203_000041 [Vitis vinifera]